MQIVVVSDVGIDVFKSWREVKKYTSFTKADFSQVGASDFILSVDGNSYEISKDIKLLVRVASEKVFSKSTYDINNIMIWVAAFLSLLIYFKI